MAIQDSINQYTTRFKEMPVTFKAAIIGAVLLFAGVVSVILFMDRGPQYQPLYSNLSAEDSGAVIERLKDLRVQYKVSGNTINVPADKVYELRMELAGQGLPQGGGVGFEIFDKSGFGVTEFVQKVNYRRALQGELSRTIAQIKEVESARVHLAIPDKGVFIEDKKGSKASIILKLRQGKQLTQGQVDSIVHLVSNSFDDLKPEDVTVVDTAGRMWTRPSGEDQGVLALSAKQLDYKRGLERDLESRVQSMLEKAVGLNKAVARVSIELDTKHVERMEEKYDPDSQVIRSEQRIKESSVGSLVTVGVPGVMSNLPDLTAPAQQAQTTPPSASKQNDVINYEISKVTSKVVEPVGAIERLTVAVLVDGSYEAVKGEDGKETSKFVARSDDEIAKFTDMVKNAVGYSASRGDAITVVSAPFDEKFADVEFEKPPVIPPYMIPPLIKYGSLVAVTLLVILFILRPLMKKADEEKKAAAAAAAEAEALGAGAGALTEGVEVSINEPAEKLRLLVRTNPEQAAMILKGWLREAKQ